MQASKLLPLINLKLLVWTATVMPLVSLISLAVTLLIIFRRIGDLRRKASA